MSEPELSLDERSVDTCIEVLLKLKQWNGRYKPAANCYGDGLWTKDIIHRLNGLEHWSKDLGLILEARATLQSLVGVHNILGDLLGSLETSLSAIQTALLPFQLGKGLDSLPNDVLSMIFEYTDSRETLARVSRRFRRVASTIPQLWNGISNYMKSKNHVVESLKNSKGVGLDMHLYIRPDEAEPTTLDPLEVLDAALPHGERWENLKVSAGHVDIWMRLEINFTAIREKCANVQFTRLRSLSIEYPDGFDEDEEDEIFDDPNSVLHFFESLSMPVLQNLCIINLIPNPFAVPTLRSLRIELHGAISVERSPRCLAEFLSSFPQLENLQLALGAEMKDESIPPIVLPKLESLRIDVMHWLTKETLKLRKAFVTPAIRRMHFNIDQHADDDRPNLTEWLEALLCHDEYPTLEELTFVFSDHSNSSSYRIPFEKLPVLRTLTLDTPDRYPKYTWDDTESARIPPLRDLYLKEVDSRWTYWLESTQKMLHDREEKWTGFQGLTINVASYSDVDHVGRLFVGKEITWEERGIQDRYSVFS